PADKIDALEAVFEQVYDVVLQQSLKLKVHGAVQPQAFNRLISPRLKIQQRLERVQGDRGKLRAGSHVIGADDAAIGHAEILVARLDLLLPDSAREQRRLEADQSKQVQLEIACRQAQIGFGRAQPAERVVEQPEQRRVLFLKFAEEVDQFGQVIRIRAAF